MHIDSKINLKLLLNQKNIQLISEITNNEDKWFLIHLVVQPTKQKNFSHYIKPQQSSLMFYHFSIFISIILFVCICVCFLFFKYFCFSPIFAGTFSRIEQFLPFFFSLMSWKVYQYWIKKQKENEKIKDSHKKPKWEKISFK